MAWPNTLQSTNTIPTLSSPMSNLFNNLESTVASLNPITKPIQNQGDKSNSVAPYRNGVNAAQWISLASGALGMYGSYLGTKGQVRALRAQAAEYDAQRGLNYEAYRNQVNYLAEENLYNVERIRQEYRDISGEQMVAIGASGFDVSAGEERVLKDTDQKAKDAIYLANRNTYVQSFELWRSTMIENERLKAAAQMARVQAKYTKKMGTVNLIAGALGTAANFINLGSYGGTGDVDVRGRSKK